jgi:hypothetical protein
MALTMRKEAKGLGVPDINEVSPLTNIQRDLRTGNLKLPLNSIGEEGSLNDIQYNDVKNNVARDLSLSNAGEN